MLAGIVTDRKKKEGIELLEKIPEYDGICVRSSTKVTREIIEAGAKGRLKIIGRAGVGFDNIDAGAASENGIVVKYAPHGNTNSTAEMALGLMLAVSRNIPQANQSLVNGIWVKRPFQGTELSRKTLGIVGCGRIGKRLAELVRGFDMKVIGYDLNEDKEAPIEYTLLDALLKQADYVSVHVGGK